MIKLQIITLLILLTLSTAYSNCRSIYFKLNEIEIKKLNGNAENVFYDYYACTSIAYGFLGVRDVCFNMFKTELDLHWEIVL